MTCAFCDTSIITTDFDLTFVIVNDLKEILSTFLLMIDVPNMTFGAKPDTTRNLTFFKSCAIRRPIPSFISMGALEADGRWLSFTGFISGSDVVIKNLYWICFGSALVSKMAINVVKRFLASTDISSLWLPSCNFLLHSNIRVVSSSSRAIIDLIKTTHSIDRYYWSSLLLRSKLFQLCGFLRSLVLRSRIWTWVLWRLPETTHPCSHFLSDWDRRFSSWRLALWASSVVNSAALHSKTAYSTYSQRYWCLLVFFFFIHSRMIRWTLELSAFLVCLTNSFHPVGVHCNAHLSIVWSRAGHTWNCYTRVITDYFSLNGLAFKAIILAIKYPESCPSTCASTECILVRCPRPRLRPWPLRRLHVLSRFANSAKSVSDGDGSLPPSCVRISAYCAS